MRKIAIITIGLFLFLGTQAVVLPAHASETAQIRIDVEFAAQELAAAQSKVKLAANLVERVIAQQNYLDLVAKYEKLQGRVAKSAAQSRAHSANQKFAVTTASR